MLQSVYLKRLVLLLPAVLLIPSLSLAMADQLLLREDLLTTFIGIPSSLLYESVLGSLVYLLLAFTYCRDQVRLYPNLAGLIPISCICTPILVSSLVISLNWMLDSSAVQAHQVKVLGSKQVKKYYYGETTDWRATKSPIFYNDANSFLRAFPQGSTVEVDTKSGFFGYERLIAVRPVSAATTVKHDASH